MTFVKLIECPRDAWQGLPDFIPTKLKAAYLQELVLAAVNEASRRVDEELSKQVKDLTGNMPNMMGLKIPGLF